MKILFIVRSIGYGGASKQLALTANAMAKRGHDVAIYSYNMNVLKQELDSKVKYIPQSELCRNKLEEYLFSPWRIRREIQRRKADIVVSWRANAGCFTSLACLGLNHVKHVFSERTDPYTETSFFLKIATRLCRWADGGIFQTEMARDYYGQKMAKRSVVIPNPIPDNTVLPEIVPIEQRQKKVAWVGRFFMKQKRMDVMVKAWAEVHKRLPDYKLVFYGDGSGMTQTQQMVREYGLEECVEFKGAVKGIIDIIKDHALLVMTSDYEGIPNTILEAFIAGVPVVTTDCSPGGARVLIEDGKNGIVVPIGNHKQLSEKILFVLDSPIIIGDFIDKSRTKLENFYPVQIFEQWNNYLCSIAFQ